MKGFNQRIFEMLCRLVVFARTYPQFFVRTSLAGQAMAQIESAVEKLAAHDTSLKGKEVAVKISREERIKARTELRDCLETISRIAKGLRLGQFALPRGRSDATLVSVGRMWAEHVEPLKQVFIDSGLPDLTQRLNAAVETVSRVIDEQTHCKGARLAAISAITQTRNDAFSALQRLDPILTHLLRGDPPARAVWERARRVERSASPKPVEVEASPPANVTPPAS